MKKLLFILILSLGIVSCTSVRYVMIDPKDSTKLIEIRKRIVYDDYYTTPPSPLYYNYYGRPYSYPFFYSPIIIRPQGPQRPDFGPLPPSPRPRH